MGQGFMNEKDLILHKTADRRLKKTDPYRVFNYTRHKSKMQYEITLLFTIRVSSLVRWQGVEP